MAQLKERKSGESQIDFEEMVRTQTPIRLMAAANPKDFRSSVFFIGTRKFYPRAGFYPVIGRFYDLLFKKTTSGTFFLEPVEPEKLTKEEWDILGQRYFREVLRERNGRLFFRLKSGMILVPMDIDQWIKAGARNFIGKVIELTGLPRATSYVVWSKYGSDHMDATELLQGTVNLEEEALKEMGMIKILDQTIPAIYVLGIDPDEVLTENMIKTKAREAMRTYHPDSNKAGQIKIKVDINATFAPTKIFESIGPARDMLLENYRWHGSTWNQVIGNDLAVNGDNEEEQPIDPLLEKVAEMAIRVSTTPAPAPVAPINAPPAIKPARAKRTDGKAAKKSRK